MKLRIDPMPHARAAAEQRINQHFDWLAQQSLHRDQEHQRKRKAAEDHLAGRGAAPSWFREAAAIEGKSTDEFARELHDKPDDLAERGNARRKLILAIRSATSPADIERILVGAGLSAGGI